MMSRITNNVYTMHYSCVLPDSWILLNLGDHVNISLWACVLWYLDIDISKSATEVTWYSPGNLAKWLDLEENFQVTWASRQEIELRAQTCTIRQFFPEHLKVHDRIF